MTYISPSKVHATAERRAVRELKRLHAVEYRVLMERWRTLVRREFEEEANRKSQRFTDA